MKLNFGCGQKIKEGWINVDIQKDKKINKSFNFEKFPYPFKDNTFTYILVDNVLEHLENCQEVLDELWRISKKNGIINIIVPYWNSKGAYNDPTHKHYFNERSFEILTQTKHKYLLNTKKKYEIESLKLVPIKLFKIFPTSINKKLGNYLCNIINNIDVKIKVIK